MKHLRKKCTNLEKCWKENMHNKNEQMGKIWEKITEIKEGKIGGDQKQSLRKWGKGKKCLKKQIHSSTPFYKYTHLKNLIRWMCTGWTI